MDHPFFRDAQDSPIIRTVQRTFRREIDLISDLIRPIRFNLNAFFGKKENQFEAIANKSNEAHHQIYDSVHVQIKNAIESKNAKQFNVHDFEALLSGLEMDKIVKLVRTYIDSELHCALSTPTTSRIDHQLLCATIWHLKKTYQIEDSELCEQTFAYLITVYTNIENLNAKLFALINLCEWPIGKEEKIVLEKASDMLFAKYHRWNNYFTNKDIFQLLSESAFEQLDYQLYFCLEQFYGNVFNSTGQLSKKNSQIAMTLNPKDRSNQLKLSTDLLSARSDWQWQSVRATDKVGTFYYEVVLLTSGQMCFGWATKRHEIDNTDAVQPIGHDEHSIGFDGYNGCILNHGKKLTTSETTWWKVGNVIGCAIDCYKGTFNFSVNGSAIKISRTKVFFSSLPYYPAASLSSHQQCYFNFGQVPFKFLPKKLYQPIIQSSIVHSKISQYHHQNINDFNIQFNNSISMSRNGLLSSSNRVISESLNLKTDGDNGCKICHRPIDTMLQFTKCKRNFTFCVDCLSYLGGCPCCKEDYKTDLSVCSLCHEEDNGRLIQFTCCDSLKFCRHCAPMLRSCPKCKKYNKIT